MTGLEMASGDADTYPPYRDLFRPDNIPPGSSWRVFGENDEWGTLNFLTETAVTRAAQLVRRGKVYSLDYELDSFDPYPTGTRRKTRHSIFQNNPHHRDDYLDSFYLQAGSQVDGLRHMRHPEYGFYGGVNEKEIGPNTPRLGIQHWAAKGIVGPGKLIDVGRYLSDVGRPIQMESGQQIELADVLSAAESQGTLVEKGDMVVLRTGWCDHYLHSMDDESRRRLTEETLCPGIAQDEQYLEWLWDHQVALLAADNVAVEALPAAGESSFGRSSADALSSGVSNEGMMHRVLIPLLGMALGEMWNLELLAADAAVDGVYEFMLVVKPLAVRGGVGSPGNITAIK